MRAQESQRVRESGGGRERRKTRARTRESARVHARGREGGEEGEGGARQQGSEGRTSRGRAEGGREGVRMHERERVCMRESANARERASKRESKNDKACASESEKEQSEQMCVLNGRERAIGSGDYSSTVFVLSRPCHSHTHA